MTFQKYILYLILTLSPFTLFPQKFGFSELLANAPHKKIPFTIENNAKNNAFLRKEGVEIKRKTENWIYITQSPAWVFKQLSHNFISDFYFEYAPPALLDDSVRTMFDVNQVHSGIPPLLDSYTGKGVIIGIVDNGLDHRHPDFIDENGRNRIIRYWDHSVISPTASPSPYNYGQIWYADQIQDGDITSNEESSGHGTSVSGICAGNGLANGKNKGMAPEADIIFVETNFNLPNWTLTIADACDYIFKVADSLNKPAVINLSVGSYLGSHDGKDPAGELIELLVEEKPGRIVVSAAGNSGDKPAYHAQKTMSVADTNFIWFKNNPNGTLGANTVFFDLWTTVSEAQFYYSFGANSNTSSYADVAATKYRFSQLNVGTPIYDTLFNVNGDRIATLEVYTEYVGDNYHLQGFFSKVDSVDYLMRFSTTGQGKYDLWSGEWLGLNMIVSEIPTPAEYPPIVNYVLPDSAQSIVSSWNCSPKVISVANVRGRLSYIDNNGNPYYSATMTPPGKIALSSSRGPSRRGEIKPDISAAGDVTLGSAPLFMVGDPAYNALLEEGGYHMRNGGTSMASPVVAGIAALYLERCPNSTFEDFKSDLFGSATSDSYTGLTPNNQYGYGKINALNLLVSKNNNLKVLGDTVICQMPVNLTANIPLINYEWSDGSFAPNILVSQPTVVYLSGQDLQGCQIYSDTLIVAQGSPLDNPTISTSGNLLVSSNAPNYQWYLNDHPISGATQQTYSPSGVGFYSVAIQGEDNCKSFSNAIEWTLNSSDEHLTSFVVYPNPTKSTLNVKTNGEIITAVEILNIAGQSIVHQSVVSHQISVNTERLSSGAYLLKIHTSDRIEVFPFFKE